MNELIDRYTANEMGDAERSNFEEILRTNPLLRAEVRLDMEITRCLEDQQTLRFVEQLLMLRKQNGKKGFHWQYLLLAASFLLLVALGVFLVNRLEWENSGFYRQIGQSEIQNKQASKHPIACFRRHHGEQKPTPAARREWIKNRTLALRYRPLPEYELLIGSISRSFSFKVISPSCRLSLPSHSTIPFEWETQGTCSFLVLQITDNLGKKIFETAPIQGFTFNLNTDTFARGRYYWKLIGDENLVAMGYFILH